MKKKRLKAPNGYRIEEWIDGTFHVYWCSGNIKWCIDETLNRKDALKVAKAHKEMCLLLDKSRKGL